MITITLHGNFEMVFIGRIQSKDILEILIVGNGLNDSLQNNTWNDIFTIGPSQASDKKLHTRCICMLLCLMPLEKDSGSYLILNVYIFLCI